MIDPTTGKEIRKTDAGPAANSPEQIAAQTAAAEAAEKLAAACAADNCCVPVKTTNPSPGAVVGALVLPASPAPANAWQLPRNIHAALAKDTDTQSHLMISARPALADTLYAALRNAPPGGCLDAGSVWRLRVSALPFGHNAPLRQVRFDDTAKRPILDEWTIDNPCNQPPTPPPTNTDEEPKAQTEEERKAKTEEERKSQSEKYESHRRVRPGYRDQGGT